MKKLIPLILLFIISACGGIEPAERAKIAGKIADDYAFNKSVVRGGQFSLATFQKIVNPSYDYYIYLEGDGLISRGGRLTKDPTPVNPLTLKLATLDNRGNIVYIARPGQYQAGNVSQDYWHKARYSKEVVDSLVKIIKQIAGKNNVHLIGYSGGGALAVLVAASGEVNVKSITTIAGNLDIEAFSHYHSGERLTSSENPMNYANRVSHIPQLHISGDKDTRVPSFIAEKYKEASHSDLVEVKIIDATHSTGIEQFWRGLVNRRK